MNRRGAHGHGWIVGLAGVVAGLALMILAPGLKGVSRAVLLFAGLHIVGALVIGGSIYLSWIRGALGQDPAAATAIRFRAGAGWLNAQGVAALALTGGAAALQASTPEAWPISFAMIALAALLCAGAVVAGDFTATDAAALPALDFGAPQAVLDMGAGAGRATLALGHALPQASITALDSFAADSAGARRLARNLVLTGLGGRVAVRTQALTPLPFPDAAFDLAVSANVLDHREPRARALAEALRVLRPGGRCLLVVRTRGLAMAAVLGPLALLLWPRARWSRLARDAGFTLLAEGRIGHASYLWLAKPGD